MTTWLKKGSACDTHFAQPSVGEGLYAHSETLLEQAAAEGIKPTDNDVSITSYSWKCVENCDVPVFAWREVVKEKFPIMRVTKSYGPFTPEHNGDEMKISLNSPVPMAFATVSPEEAANLRANPEGFDSTIAKSRCQQRAALSDDGQEEHLHRRSI
jgi:hypothetical protein